jgi:hypothetical protein
VPRNSPVIFFTSLCSSRVRSVTHPVLERPLCPVDDWFVARDAFLLDIPVHVTLEVDREPRLAMLPADVLAGGILPRPNFEFVVPAIGSSRHVAWLDVQDLKDTKPTRPSVVSLSLRRSSAPAAGARGTPHERARRSRYRPCCARFASCFSEKARNLTSG